MSEEILYIDDGGLVYYINENEFITCDEIPMPMLEGIKHLQQKVEQLEKENEHLRTQVNAYENPNDLTLFYMWLDEKAKDKIKQLENIRKEAIECIKTDSIEINTKEYGNLTVINSDDLLNILNKGDNNGK